MKSKKKKTKNLKKKFFQKNKKKFQKICNLVKIKKNYQKNRKKKEIYNEILIILLDEFKVISIIIYLLIILTIVDENAL